MEDATVLEEEEEEEEAEAEKDLLKAPLAEEIDL